MAQTIYSKAWADAATAGAIAALGLGTAATTDADPHRGDRDCYHVRRRAAGRGRTALVH